MVLEAADIARIVLVGIVTIGYIPMIVSWRRHGSTWMFLAYSALVAGAALLFAVELSGVPGSTLVFGIPAAITASSILFFVSAYRSQKTINELEEEVQDASVPLRGDTP